MQEITFPYPSCQWELERWRFDRTRLFCMDPPLIKTRNYHFIKEDYGRNPATALSRISSLIWGYCGKLFRTLLHTSMASTFLLAFRKLKASLYPTWADSSFSYLNYTELFSPCHREIESPTIKCQLTTREATYCAAWQLFTLHCNTIVHICLPIIASFWTPKLRKRRLMYHFCNLRLVLRPP